MQSVTHQSHRDLEISSFAQDTSPAAQSNEFRTSEPQVTEATGVTGGAGATEVANGEPSESIERKQSGPRAGRGPHHEYDIDGLRRGLDDFILRGMYVLVAITAPGERFVIRALKQFRGTGLGAELDEEMKRLMAEEAVHIREHEKLADVLERGVCTGNSWFKRARERFLKPRSWMSKRLALAVAAGYEHAADGYLEAFQHHLDEVRRTQGPAARNKLDEGGLVDLFEWHAKEEFGHRSVAFDVLQQVGVGYWMRILGQLIVAFDLICVATPGMLSLTRLSDWWRVPMLLTRGCYGRRVFDHMVEYTRRDFHPEQSELGRLMDATPAVG